jgi:hypothetical protein
MKAKGAKQSNKAKFKGAKQSNEAKPKSRRKTWSKKSGRTGRKGN